MSVVSNVYLEAQDNSLLIRATDIKIASRLECQSMCRNPAT